MISDPRISAAGVWQLCLDLAPCTYTAPPDAFPLEMTLPGTTAQQQIGTYNTARCDGCLTEKYPFSGQIWLRKTVTIPPAQIGKPCLLHLERTRMTRLWVNGVYLGSENSLCTPHIYDLTGHTAETMELVLCVKNTDYPISGGHMTSPDTQTNWIGVTGMVRLEFHEAVYLSDLQAYPDAESRRVTVKGILHGAESVQAEIVHGDSAHAADDLAWNETLTADASGACSVTLQYPADYPLWDEYHPQITALTFHLPDGESAAVTFAFRSFKACGDHFEINGTRTMLRGKHDGMVFPLTGAAPTDSREWARVLRLMKDWGINHYRFHTCCPPEAAFAAADAVGIYMEPELPFWGTIDAPDGEKFNAAEQAYLLREGLRICKAFGNHPSFCMLSLGNELWGSPVRLGEIIETLRAADPRPLYTQGSNNFQHMPLQILQEDFWTGVRTGKGKLLRGSFADCDAPIGRIQTDAPSASWDYEQYLVPQTAYHEGDADTGETEIEIQYGTGVKRVRAAAHEADFVPSVPVVTHEVGQYNCYPDYDEIPHYTGVTEARNLEIFRERLEAAGMGAQAREFFACAGAFSRDCYKNEIEAAMRSPHIAGFQLLDLQDFPGQGTALVGMLNALLENKGFIEPEQWRGFCGDLVPLALFDSYVWTAGETVQIGYALRNNRPQLRAQRLEITLTCGEHLIASASAEIPESTPNYISLGTGSFRIAPQQAGKALLTLSLPAEGIRNTWRITILPPVSPVQEVITVHSYSEAEPYLQQGARVLLIPEQITEKVEGFYCTDFWNYHMFKIISESMGRKVPVGTMGLCIDTAHPIAQAMFSEKHSTPQWYSAVTHSDCAVLDAAPAGFRPIVQTIDNVERNHRLGVIFETAVGSGRLLICTVRLHEVPEDVSINRLHHALTDYLQSDAFAPAEQLSPTLLRQLFG